MGIAVSTAASRRWTPSVGITNESLAPTVSAERLFLRGGSAALGETEARDESANPLAGAIGPSELLGDKKP